MWLQAPARVIGEGIALSLWFRIPACLFFRVQPTETADHLTALRTEHAALVLQRTTLEDSYRVSTVEECGMELEFVDAKIAKARSTPQQNKRLQAIHEAHRAVLSKEAEIKGAGEDDNEQDEVKKIHEIHVNIGTCARACIRRSMHAHTQKF